MLHRIDEMMRMPQCGMTANAPQRAGVCLVVRGIDIHYPSENSFHFVKGLAVY